MPRLFFAVELGVGVRGAIQDGIDGLAIPKPSWHWVSQDNFHITLKFIGDFSSGRLDELCACARVVADSVPDFDITLGAMGGFPDLRRPRVLFYRVNRGADALGDLARKLDGSLASRLGIPRETRPFRAHATIARIKGPIQPAVSSQLESAPPLEGVSQRVLDIALIESHLAREGATYQRVKGFALQKSKC